jgi:hypothetical protein
MAAADLSDVEFVNRWIIEMEGVIDEASSTAGST